MDSKHFYTLQSEITNPGALAYLYDDLPNDIPALCQIIQGLILHCYDANLFSYEITAHRYREMDDRHVESMLKRLISRHAKPLNQSRDLHQRLLGVCRDNSVLLCSILRHKQIPARLRSGFVTYFIPDFYLDSVATEYWDESKKKWCIVDARLNESYAKHFKLNIDFDLMDVPADRFISAEKAWQMCRFETEKSNHFGSRQHRGLWYVRNRLIHELAFINKYEMLIWDLWGMMLTPQNNKPQISENQYLKLDQLAKLLASPEVELVVKKSFYNDHFDFHIPAVISVFNPFLNRRFDHVKI